ncbi:hypothetical protein ZIOFF_066381 [Zingiber officinale]|uniref:Iron-sulfur cluster biosynthesis family protein n=1 Tax=Zingiber officinale TaxID=94328 RepID=A0A8J5EYA6_ZINOF|nr:hypothetical protein ZIOFF_066381 [Zingiber officinale]
MEGLCDPSATVAESSNPSAVTTGSCNTSHLSWVWCRVVPVPVVERNETFHPFRPFRHGESGVAVTRLVTLPAIADASCNAFSGCGHLPRAILHWVYWDLEISAMKPVLYRRNTYFTCSGTLVYHAISFIWVSDEGDVLYTFPKDYRSKLLTKSFKMKVEPFLNKIKTAAAYLVRVSFGTALITSIVLVYTTIIALASSSSRSEGENGRGRRGRGTKVSFVTMNHLCRYWDMNYYRRRQMRQEGGMNFVESVFSFVFGDGDPNQGLEEERWKLIGQYISSNGGVVAAEELAPYLDVPLIDETQDDESFVLPVLIRFQGYPEVDDQGNILYRFPSLQRTASSLKVGKKEYVGKKWAEWINGVEKYFEEKKWKFSEIGASEKAMVIGLGALNLFGVIVLGSMLKDVSIAPQGLVSFVSQIFPLLQIYAASFFTIPLIRWFLLLRTNQGIEKRNRARKQRAQILDRPDPSLRRKLLNARDMSQQTTISPDRIVYTTEKDFVDQDYEDLEMMDFFREWGGT